MILVRNCNKISKKSQLLAFIDWTKIPTQLQWPILNIRVLLVDDRKRLLDDIPYKIQRIPTIHLNNSTMAILFPYL